MEEKRAKVTIPELQAMVERGERITFLTAYDCPTALLGDRAGMDIILVGDSGAMCLLGHKTTLPATMDFMVASTAAVSRAATRAFVVGDMPYMSYQPSNETTVRNAGRFIAEGGARISSGEERKTPIWHSDCRACIGVSTGASSWASARFPSWPWRLITGDCDGSVAAGASGGLRI